MSETFTDKGKGTWVNLSDKDAELFKQFRQYQNDFKLLLENGIFAPLVGSKTIHKNSSEIKMIETHIIVRI